MFSKIDDESKQEHDNLTYCLQDEVANIRDFMPTPSQMPRIYSLPSNFTASMKLFISPWLVAESDPEELW